MCRLINTLLFLPGKHFIFKTKVFLDENVAILFYLRFSLHSVNMKCVD